MIQSMLRMRAENNGVNVWEIPHSELLPQLRRTLNDCSRDCDQTIQRLQLVGSSRKSSQDFNNDLTLVKRKITKLTLKIAPFDNYLLEDIDRKALTASWVKLAVRIEEVKARNANRLLFDTIALTFVDDIIRKLNQAVGEVPENFYDTKTHELAQSVRSDKLFTDFCNRLEYFKQRTIHTVDHPSLIISFSYADYEIAKLINELLKLAMKDVRFIDDMGPKAGRDIGGFQGKFHNTDFILVIASSSYGMKARSRAPSGVKTESIIIADRYRVHPDCVIPLIVEGSPDVSLPQQMAHAQFGYLDAQSPQKLLTGIAELLKAVFKARGVDEELKELFQ